MHPDEELAVPVLLEEGEQTCPSNQALYVSESRIEAPLPADIMSVLEELRKFRAM